MLESKMSTSNSAEQVRELFGREAQQYDRRHYGSGYRTYISDRQELIAATFGSLSIAKDARVLDVGCGPGRFLQFAATAGARVTGLDSSLDMLRTSRKRLGERAALVRGDALALPFPAESFDVINCAGLIEYLPNPHILLAEFARISKPGGWVMVSSTNRRSPAFALAPLINATRRSPLIRGVLRTLRLPVNETSLRQRPLTFHTPEALESLMQEAGFGRVSVRYCHLQLVPHPIDHVLPALTSACVGFTDRWLSHRRWRGLAEGLLAIGTR